MLLIEVMLGSVSRVGSSGVDLMGWIMEPRPIWRCVDCHTVMISWCGRQNASKEVGIPGQLHEGLEELNRWQLPFWMRAIGISFAPLHGVHNEVPFAEDCALGQMEAPMNRVGLAVLGSLVVSLAACGDAGNNSTTEKAAAKPEAKMDAKGEAAAPDKPSVDKARAAEGGAAPDSEKEASRQRDAEVRAIVERLANENRDEAADDRPPADVSAPADDRAPAEEEDASLPIQPW